MKKVFLSLTVGLSLSLYSSENFEDKHFKCTLESKGYENITERQAESLNEFNIDVLITKTDLKIGRKTFKFEKVEDGKDIYSYHIYKNEYQKAYILYQTYVRIATALRIFILYIFNFLSSHNLLKIFIFQLILLFKPLIFIF